MEFEDLSGYQMCHLKDTMESVLKEKRVADKAKITLQQYQKFESGARNIMTSSFQLACRVIEALGMNISDFYHGEYTIGEEVYAEDGVLKYVKTGKDIHMDVEPVAAEERKGSRDA